MPALVTHYLHALDVLEKCSNLNLNKDAFCLGAQGPDFFYFHRVIPLLQAGKSLRQVGSLIHSQTPDKLFEAFSKFLNKNDDNISLSYTLGFIAHYSLDRVAHPFIFYIQSDIIKSEGIKYNPSYVHSRIEHNLDVIMLRDKLDVFANEFRSYECLTNNKDILKTSAQLLEFVINDLNIYKINENQILRAFLDSRFFQRLSYDPFSIKKSIVRFIEKICFMPESFSTFIRPMMEDNKYDYSNFEKNHWSNPFDDNSEQGNSSFFEVFDMAVDDAVNLINKFMTVLKENKNFEFTDNLSFKTGLKMPL